MTLNSVLSISALIISLFALGLNASQFFIKRYEDKRKYANLSFAWLCNCDYPSNTKNNLTGLSGLVEIVNSNNLPIQEVFIFLTSNRSTGKLKNLTVINGYESMHYVETVVPGKMHIQCSLNGGGAGGEHDAVAIIFSDAAGNTWYKNAKNKLYKIKEKDKAEFFEKNELFMPYPRAIEVNA